MRYYLHIFLCGILLSMANPLGAQGLVDSSPSGRYAVLLVIDGLGDGRFDDLAKNGKIPELTGEFISQGRRVEQANSLWPSLADKDFLSVLASRPVAINNKSSALQTADPDAIAALSQKGTSLGMPQVYRDQASTTAIHVFLNKNKVQTNHGAATLDNGPQFLPPQIVVLHVQAYAQAVVSGVETAVQEQILCQIDRDFADLLQSYQQSGLRAQTSFVLLSSSGVVAGPNIISAQAIEQDLMPRSRRHSSHLGNLLNAFSPLSVNGYGALLFTGPKQAEASHAQIFAPTLAQIFAATGIRRRGQKAALQRLVRRHGVDVLVARESLSEDGLLEKLRIIGRESESLLQIRDGDQFNYQVLRGRDPLGIRWAYPLKAERFHHESLWQERAENGATFSRPLSRIARLLDLQPQAGLVLIAKPGYRFSEQGWSVPFARQAVIAWSGPGQAGLPKEMNSLDVMPSLRALVGMPEDTQAEGEVVESIVRADARQVEKKLAEILLNELRSAFSAGRQYSRSVVDNSELRRFGQPPSYFLPIHQDLMQLQVADVLPSPKLRAQIGVRRSLRASCASLQQRIIKQVNKHSPIHLREVESLTRPELMLSNFIVNPRVRALVHILEGPERRERNAAENEVPSGVDSGE